MELWDVLDMDGNKKGYTHIRGIPLTEGDYHLVVSVWTINSNKEVLLTLRDETKAEYPNFWENTCGSAVSGESSLEAVVRELYEETGISANPEEMIFLGRDIHNDTFYDNYIIKKDVARSDMKMQKGETADAKWVDGKTLDYMAKKGDIAPPVIRRLKMIREDFDRFVSEA